ncbi:lysine N(6)-hydroxylase/L-ornithine N(5)-oxygenase family protein [Actinoplanes couchii]|uniref:L-lysine N6-monooxygenase MbtG n=1 Tax=Actinoplanes couchii TaxID=403638 RepID=A0ABQ3WZC5_9ACTN|nr:SidA/IucD/PvdA family monooxygenase [Actinoplanes couchii]MDR6316013.1 L-ornithine N5-oxygenase [Actinoplanes couchii]GID51627.1 lysine/ornithine N-monooxygenase [Actinoplanes couchii]
MSEEPSGGHGSVHDLIGVGFGPSNLALAIAIAEHNAELGRAPGARPVKAAFVERQRGFGWHRGMLLEDATMQVSFLKDLVTLRNPKSGFSFLCYLQSRDRLVDFINQKNFFPSRMEFHDYLQWAAELVDGEVTYGREAVAIHPVLRDGEVTCFDVVAADVDGTAEPIVMRARNLVLGTGLVPRLPDGVTADDRIWHTRDLLPNAERLKRDTPSPRRLVVVGAGQSAAEAVDYLHREFPRAEVNAVITRYGYSPADDSAFANRIFDPAAVDEYFAAPAHVKQMMMVYHGNTNYSVVDQDLIEDLSRRVYQEKVRGEERLRLLNVSRVTEAVRAGERVRTVVESMITGERLTLEADAVVFATGYRQPDPFVLLGDLAGECRRDEAGQVVVARDYRIDMAPHITAGVYLQGGTEHTHGISSSLLSNTSIRSAEILGSVVRSGVPARRPAPVG